MFLCAPPLLPAMGVWSLGHTGQQDPWWGQALPTHPVGRLAEIPGRVHVRWVGKFCMPACVDAQLAVVDMPTNRASLTSHCRVTDDSGPGWPEGNERGVTPEMVSKLCEKGHLPEAIEALQVLVQTDCHISTALFWTVLKECVRKKDLTMGRIVHALSVKRGYESDTFLCNHFLRMYASYGRLQEARTVFNLVAKPDAHTWSAIMSALVKLGHDKQAIQLYHQMRKSNVKADGHVYVAALQACARGADLKTGQQVHADVLGNGVEPHLFVWNCLVDMYAKCGSLDEARTVFDGLGEKDVVTWNAMIAGYTQQGMGHSALRLYNAMQEEGMAAPDAVTFACLLQACANVAALHLGRQLHGQIKEQGLLADVFVASSLINMYTKSGSMVDAQLVFDALPERDLVTWNALIAGYTCQGHSEQVFGLVQRMIEDGKLPDSVTFLSVLTVCSHTGLVGEGREYFELMRGRYRIAPSVDHYTCMVDVLGRAGLLDDALDLVRTMPVSPDAAVWSTLLGSCQKWNNVEVGRHAFNEAVKLDQKDAAAYVMMSNIYAGAQMWEQALEMQERRVGIGAWKQPGQSWWTDLDGLVHTFSVRELKHVGNESRLKRLPSTMGKRNILQSGIRDRQGNI